MSLGMALALVAAVVAVLVVAGRLLGVEIHRRDVAREYAPGRVLVVTRDVTRQECPWLDDDIGAGTVVREYLGPTYGLRGEGCIAVSRDGGVPFFELPSDATADAPDAG
jgi:hypothetical protein